MTGRGRAGMSLTARLIVFGLIACLPTVAVIVYLESELRRAREAEVIETVSRQTRQATSELARFVEGTRMLLTAVASAPLVRRLDPMACEFLANIRKETPSVQAIVLVAPGNAAHCPAEPGEPTATELADFVEAVRRENRFLIGTFLRAEGDRPRHGLPIGATVRDGDDRIVAVAVAILEIEHLNAIVNRWSVGPGGALTLADRNGVIMARSPFPERFIGTVIPPGFQRWVQAEGMGIERALSQDGTARIIAYKPAALNPEGIYLSSGISEREAFAAIDAARRWALGIILSGTLVALGGAWWAGRRFVRKPVADLEALAEAWREGRRADALSLPPGDEFGAIGAALDRMGAELEERGTAAIRSEERLRRTIRAAPHPLMLHAEDGEVLEVSDSWIEFSGQPRETLHSSVEWLETAVRLTGDDDPVAAPFAQQSPIEGLERTVITADGRERIWDFSIVPLERLADGRRLCLTAAVDVTERYRAAEQQNLLLRELDHRVKNTLATVQSIAAQTFRSTPDPEVFRQKFSERLGALARTHDMLTKGNWRGVSLRGLIEAELAHVPAPERIHVVGTDVVLPPEMAVPIGLILHELTTNAIKYGALSANEGRLDVGWIRSRTEAAPFGLTLTWTERDGPTVSQPTRTGFGSRLVSQLSRSLGEAESEYRPEGLRFRLRIDLPTPAEGPASRPEPHAAE